METINGHGRSLRSPTVSFEIDESDISGTVSYSYGGHSYVYREGTLDPGHTETNDPLSYPDNPSDERYVSSHVVTNASIHMRASVDPADIPVIEYRWDFGDGVVGYGPEVTHTWLTASPNISTRLTATLVDGRKIHANQVMNLVPGYPVVATPVPASPSSAYTPPDDSGGSGPGDYDFLLKDYVADGANAYLIGGSFTPDWYLKSTSDAGGGVYYGAFVYNTPLFPPGNFSLSARFRTDANGHSPQQLSLNAGANSSSPPEYSFISYFNDTSGFSASITGAGGSSTGGTTPGIVLQPYTTYWMQNRRVGLTFAVDLWDHDPLVAGSGPLLQGTKTVDAGSTFGAINNMSVAQYKYDGLDTYGFVNRVRLSSSPLPI